jgi:hypothetical protein
MQLDIGMILDDGIALWASQSFDRTLSALNPKDELMDMQSPASNVGAM